jgi:hypothetical protein
MYAFVIALIIFLGLVLLVCVLISTITYFEEKNGAKLKFKAFKSFYNINPDRWDLYDGSVKCKGTINSKEYFHFGLIDYIKYKFWRRNLDKRKAERKHAESTARMIDAVKQDIKCMDLLSQSELEQAKKEITYIFYGGTNK